MRTPCWMCVLGYCITAACWLLSQLPNAVATISRGWCVAEISGEREGGEGVCV